MIIKVTQEHIDKFYDSNGNIHPFKTALNEIIDTKQYHVRCHHYKIEIVPLKGTEPPLMLFLEAEAQRFHTMMHIMDGIYLWPLEMNHQIPSKYLKTLGD